ncbi:MAG: efflux RND transporter periplasmic adaptor subunit [bacterium]
MKKILIGVVILAVVAALVGVNVKRAKNRGVEVQVAAIESRDLVEKISGSGRVEARRSVDITSSVVGKVLELAVEEGDRVETGDLILRIDPGDREAAVEQTRARLARAKAREDLARAERKQADLRLERTRGLMKENLASDADLEDAETNADIARANLGAAQGDVRDAQAALEYAEYELSRTVIRAEIPGVVVRLAVEEGENVLAGDLYNSGSSIVTIADLSVMEAHVLVDETEVVKLEPGQAAEVIVDAFPDDPIPGKVVEVGNSAYNAGSLGSQEAKDFRVRVRLDEVPKNLRPGLSARAEIVAAERKGVPAVPIEALVVRDPEKEAAAAARKGSARRAHRSTGGDESSKEIEGVFLDDGGHAKFAPVTVGIAGEKYFEVLSGLSLGDRVVRGPFEALRRLESGESLRVKKDSTRRSRKSESSPPKESPDTEENASSGEDAGTGQ